MSDAVQQAIKRMREKAPERLYCEEAEALIGTSGAMLSGSKTAPEDQTVYWNACIFNDKGQQLWHGDLNLTTRADDLQALANCTGTIHVTPEMPFRFDGFKAGRKAKGDRVVTYRAQETP